MDKTEQIKRKMIAYYAGDPRRIQHFLKVHSLARAIGFNEKLSEDEQQILEAAALTHDIGIKPAERLYGRNNGKLQEQFGPDAARELLGADFDPQTVERICFLIAHHHTYTGIADPCLQILIEADFLVNAYEDALQPESIAAFSRKVFRTATGKWLVQQLYPEAADAVSAKR